MKNDCSSRNGWLTMISLTKMKKNFEQYGEYCKCCIGNLLIKDDNNSLQDSVLSEIIGINDNIGKDECWACDLKFNGEDKLLKIKFSNLWLFIF